MSLCSACPRHCRRDRARETGYCGSPEAIRIARSALHFWEEPCISGIRGSGTIFFTGCNLRCRFCQNYDISADASAGHEVSAEGLEDVFSALIEAGAHNINLVTPSHYLNSLLPVLSARRWPVPIIWNSSAYESPEELKKLEGLVDVYLPDYKYAESALAASLSAAPDYPETALEAIREMYRQTGPCRYDDDGMIRSGTVIRHLILPGHTRNSIAALRRLHDAFGTELPVSLMAQYTPCGDLRDYPELQRRITERELSKVEEVLFELGFDGFLQEREAADKAFIPAFETSNGHNNSTEDRS